MNVDEDPEKLKEMLSLTGGRQQVPVIVEGAKVAVGSQGRFPCAAASRFLAAPDLYKRPLGEGPWVGWVR